MRRGILTREARNVWVVLLWVLSVLTVGGCGGISLGGLLSGSITDLTAEEAVQMAQEVFQLTNQERVANGLPELTWNDALAQAGATHCQDMIDNDYFAHYSLDGSDPGVRATAAGYNWQMIGENIAAGQKTPQIVVTAWMNSEDHRENILRPEFTELGVGVRLGSKGYLYWAQEFGLPFSDEW